MCLGGKTSGLVDGLDVGVQGHGESARTPSSNSSHKPMGKIEELKLECVGGMRRTREGIGYSSAMLHWRCLLDTQVEILEMQQDI